MPANETWGLDIGQTGLHAVKVRRDGRRAVIADAFFHDIASWPEDPEYEDKVLEGLQRFAREKNQDRAPVVAAIPGFMTLYRDFATTIGGKLRETVELETKQRIPFRLEEAYWDYHVLGSDGAGEVMIAVVVCRRDIINGILGILDQARLTIDALQVAPIAFANYLSFEHADGDGPIQIAIDSGARGTDLVFMNNGDFSWLRPISVAGQELTQALMSKLSITFEQAEQMKKGLGQGGAQSERAMKVLEPVLRQLASETQRSLGYYRAQNRGAKFHKIMLTGNVYRLGGAAEYLSQALNLPVESLGKPGVIDISDAAAAELHDRWPVATTAIGLGLQGVGLVKVATNLLPRDRQVARAIHSKFKFAAIAVALVGLTAIFNAVLSGGVRAAMPRLAPQVRPAEEIERLVNAQQSEFDRLRNESLRPEAEAKTLVDRATARGYTLEAQTNAIQWVEQFNGPPIADRRPDEPLERWIRNLQAGERTELIRREAENTLNGRPASTPRELSPNHENQKLYQLYKRNYGNEWPLLLNNLEDQMYTRIYWRANRAGRVVIDHMELLSDEAEENEHQGWRPSPMMERMFLDSAGQELLDQMKRTPVQTATDPMAMDPMSMDISMNMSMDMSMDMNAPLSGAPVEPKLENGKPLVGVVLAGRVIFNGFDNYTNFLPMQTHAERFRNQMARLEGVVPRSFVWELEMPPAEFSTPMPTVTPQEIPEPEYVRHGTTRPGMDGYGGGGMESANSATGRQPAEEAKSIVFEPEKELMAYWTMAFLYQPKELRDAEAATAAEAPVAP